MNEITRFGPRELWLVSEGNWVLPVHCDPHTGDGVSQTHWLVRPALPLLAAPFAQLSKRFGPNNVGRSTTFWVIHVSQLEKFATRAQGCVAREYLKWEDKQPGREMDGREQIGVNDKEDEFLNFICERSSIDRPLGRFVWRAIKEGALAWLVQCHKPIDFEVFEVHPVPFRANWKEIMLAKHARCHKSFREKRESWKRVLSRSGFMQDLGSTDLMAMRKDKSFTWTLEIIPTKLLTEEWTKAESTNIAIKRPVNYARYYESCIRRRLDSVLDVFASWIQKIQLPVGAVRESALSCDPIIVPFSKRNRVLPSWHKPGEVTFQPTNGYPVIKQGQRVKRNISGQIKDMLGVSGVLPGAENVRGLPESEPAVDGPGDIDDGTHRVLLLHAVQGETETSPVLAVGEEAKR